MASLIPSANASGTGSMTLAGPSTNSNQTIMIPDATGTMMVSGNMPAFSAYSNTAQTGLTSGVFVKAAFNTKEFDTNTNYDATTNYRFTPTVAGYYQINASANIGGTLTGSLVSIYKNGSRYKDGTYYNTVAVNNLTISCVVYCNGSTDYIEIYVYQTGTGLLIGGGGANNTWFNGSMVRGA